MQRRHTKNIIIYNLIFFICSAIFIYFYWQKIIAEAGVNAVNGLNSVLSFSAPKPFQYRILVPIITGILAFITSIDLNVIFIIFTFTVVYLIIIFFYYFLKNIFTGNNLVFFSLMILYPMIWNYVILNETFQYYDMTAILLFCICQYLIITEKMKWFYIIFPLAVLNKETIIYILFFYMLFNYRSIFTQKIIINSSLIVFIFILVKTGLWILFRNNQGDMFEITLPENINIAKNLFSNRIFAKSIFLAFGGLQYFILYYFLKTKWINKNYEYKRRAFMNLAFIPYFILGIIMVYFSEVRVYLEIIPMFTTLFIFLAAEYKKFDLECKYS